MKDIQAFPNEGFNGWGEPQQGMTLRDYFAAHALGGLLVRNWGDPTTGLPPENVHELWAKAAYMTADAMLKAREQ